MTRISSPAMHSAATSVLPMPEEQKLMQSELKRLTKDRTELGKLAEEFESVFLELAMKSMRDTVQKSELTDGGNGEEVFRSMLDGEYAKSMANQHSSGIAQSIEKQMTNIIDEQIKAIEKRLGISGYAKEASQRNSQAVANNMINKRQ